MSGLAERILEARTRAESVGPRSFLLPTSFLGASLVAVTATEPVATESFLAQSSSEDIPPEAHVMQSMTDFPTPLPLASLRNEEAMLAEIEAGMNQPSPLPRIRVKKRSTIPKNQVKKMSEPIARMKNGNGNHKANGHGVVQVLVKKKAPALDAPEKALAWLQGMVKKVHVSAIPTMLDYYRRLGWIPNEAYGWLVELATGLTKSAQPATWRMVRNDPVQLAAIHRESYKHLRGLFGERMNRSV